MSKRCAGFRHFGEVNYSYPRRVVHCVTSGMQYKLKYLKLLAVHVVPFTNMVTLIFIMFVITYPCWD